MLSPPGSPEVEPSGDRIGSEDANHVTYLHAGDESHRAFPGIVALLCRERLRGDRGVGLPKFWT